ncbi:putative Transcriptional regulator, PucR family [metagenome]|uniref:Putative Transcriptional regulator, PucR family n=1 Tax=metagenome TaxID=256318 RepID=A0A2P2C0X1_9ZZZZ
MTAPTLREVLAMPVLQRAAPEVLAGRRGLDNQVRWVHAAEVADIASLLRPGDLVLSTGIALPDSDSGQAEFAASLAEIPAAGLIIELGRRWTTLPPALVASCEQAGLPLVALTQVVKFAAITQAVGERVVDEQLAELRDAERVHETFTELGLAEAGPGEILAAVQRLAGSAVVLESDGHRVLDYLAGPGDVAGFLDDWQTRSRRVVLSGRTTWDPQNGWLVTRLGRRERGWGRLVLQSPTPPAQRLIVLAERAAAALALHRLHDRDRDNLVRRTHHELLLALQSDPTDAEVLRRCELAGFPTTRHQFVGVSIRPLRTTRGSAPVLAATVHAAHDMGVPALICELDRDILVLLALSPGASEVAAVEKLADRVSRQHATVIGAGRAAPSSSVIDRTLREAHQVLDAIRPGTESTRVVHRLEDVHLRGLLTLFGADDRLSLFVARELGSLQEYDDEHATDLTEVLRALVQHPTSKSDAAAAVHLSRPAFYARLARIESVLDVSLNDPDVRVSLHVALLAHELGAGS